MKPHPIGCTCRLWECTRRQRAAGVIVEQPLPGRRPCHLCGGPGIKNLGTQGWCAGHLSQLLQGFVPNVFDNVGIAIQIGRVRPDYGPAFVDAACVLCGATWVAIVGALCPWCPERVIDTRAHQAEILLRGVDSYLSGDRRDAAVRAWGEQLERAVQTGLIDRERADRAWNREVRHAA